MYTEITNQPYPLLYSVPLYFNTSLHKLASKICHKAKSSLLTETAFCFMIRGKMMSELKTMRPVRVTIDFVPILYLVFSVL